MAIEEASRTGGIWFSVEICEGIAGEVAIGAISSWTLRSKICDDAGECKRGEDWIPREGEEGIWGEAARATPAAGGEAMGDIEREEVAVGC